MTTIEEYFADEDNMKRLVDEFVAEQKPYNDKYDEILENRNRIFDKISMYMFDLVSRNEERFCLNDYEDVYEPKKWDLEYSLLEINVWFDILVNLGKCQRFKDRIEHMFQINEYSFLYRYDGKDFLLETFAGQGQYLYTLRLLKPEGLFVQLNLNTLRQYEKEQIEKCEKENENE